MEETKTNAPAAPKMGMAWVVAIVGILTALAICMDNYKVAATMVLLMADFGIGEGAAGWLVTSLSLMGIIVAVPFGTMLIKHGPRKMYVLSVVVTLIGCVAGAFCNNYILLLVTRFIEGFGWGTIGVLVPTLISMWFPADKRGLPSALFSTWVGLGMTLILATSAFFFDQSVPSTWHNVWWYSAVLLAVVLILGLIFIREPEVSYLDAADESEKKEVKTSEAFKSPIPWLICLGVTLVAIASVILTTFASSYCVIVLGTDAAAANSITSVRGLCMVIGGIIAGVMLNKITTVKGRMLFLVIVMFFNAIAYSTMFAWQLAWATPYMIISGLCLGFPMGIIWSCVPEFAPRPELTGIVTGIMSIGQSLGGVLGTAFGGPIIEKIGYLPFTPIAITFGVLAFVFSIVLFFLMKKKFGERFNSDDPYGIKAKMSA